MSQASLLACVAIPLVIIGCGGTEVDSELVGNWRQTLNTGVTATDIYLNLYPNGTYTYSSRMESSHGDNYSPVVRGQWKAEGGHLYAKPDGQPNWVDQGSYRLSGNGMVLHPPGGRPGYWTR